MPEHPTSLDALSPFVHAFRESAPYIRAFRGKVIVVAFGGDVVESGQFLRLTHDFNLLASLGAKLVLVHGARPQINARLNERNIEINIQNGVRRTDDATFSCVKEAIGMVSFEIEAQLSMGIANSPMANADIRVASGNFIIAQPLGVREGVDMLHSGEVRKVHSDAIRQRLDGGEIVLVSPLGYSPTGELFNLTVEDTATAVASALKAEKLIFLMDEQGLLNAEGEVLLEITVAEAKKYLSARRGALDDVGFYLPASIKALEAGVERVHMISRFIDGALLMELFTHEGIGTMLTRTRLEELRAANIDDVGGVLALIQPLEEEGILVKRSRERLETEIDRFSVLVRDGRVIGCVALYTFLEERMGELACLVVDPAYRDSGYGDLLFKHLMKDAKKQKLKQLFALSTRTAHWFLERGFAAATIADLPSEKRELYNYQRKSKVFIKPL